MQIEVKIPVSRDYVTIILEDVPGSLTNKVVSNILIQLAEQIRGLDESETKN